MVGGHDEDMAAILDVLNSPPASPHSSDNPITTTSASAISEKLEQGACQPTDDEPNKTDEAPHVIHSEHQLILKIDILKV